MLDKQDQHSFFLFQGQSILVVLSLPFFFKNVNEGTLNDLNDGFVEFESIFKLDFEGFVVVAVDELVEGLQLLWISVS